MNIPAANQWFIQRRSALQPFLVKPFNVAACQCAILKLALAFGLRQAGSEHAQGAEYDQQQKHHGGDDLRFKV